MALPVVYRDGLWKGDLDLITVISSNHTSIMHRFRYNQVLSLAGNDVRVISSLGAESKSLAVDFGEATPTLY